MARPPKLRPKPLGLWWPCNPKIFNFHLQLTTMCLWLLHMGASCR